MVRIFDIFTSYRYLCHLKFAHELYFANREAEKKAAKRKV